MPKTTFSGDVRMEPRWLPELEVAEWPRLTDDRAKHEAAVEALSAALKGEDAEAEHRALLALCDVTEAALRDLGESIDEAAVPRKAAKACKSGERVI